jgi:hypothetical protein
MDEQRFQELIHKRDTSGLTDREADELGKMIAERDGLPYSSASRRDHPEEEGQGEHPYSEAELQELRQHPDVKEVPEESERAS